MGCLFLLQQNINAESVPDEVLPDYTDLSKHFQTNIALSERWTDGRRNDVLLFHFLGSVDAKQLFLDSVDAKQLAGQLDREKNDKIWATQPQQQIVGECFFGRRTDA